MICKVVNFSFKNTSYIRLVASISSIWRINQYTIKSCFPAEKPNTTTEKRLVASFDKERCINIEHLAG